MRRRAEPLRRWWRRRRGWRGWRTRMGEPVWLRYQHYRSRCASRRSDGFPRRRGRLAASLRATGRYVQSAVKQPSLLIIAGHGLRASCHSMGWPHHWRWATSARGAAANHAAAAATIAAATAVAHARNGTAFTCGRRGGGHVTDDSSPVHFLLSTAPSLHRSTQWERKKKKKELG